MYLPIKRTTDLLLASIAALALSPILLGIMLVLRLTGEHEVFYRQRRLGYRNQPFDILKFATMLKDSPNMKGGEITLRNDPRVLPFGRFLRMTKLNELPQLFNILRGEMAIVGPRPLMEISFQMYTPEVQQVVYQSVPGLTGIASLIFRDEEKLVSNSGVEPRKFYQETIYPYKGQVELWYRRNRGLVTDIKIVVLTAWQLFVPHSMLVWDWFPDLPQPPEELGFGNPPPATNISS